MWVYDHTTVSGLPLLQQRIGKDVESTDVVVPSCIRCAATANARKSLVFAAKTCQDFIGFNPVVTVRRRDGDRRRRAVIIRLSVFVKR